MRVGFIAQALGLDHKLSRRWKPETERVEHLQECMMRIAAHPPSTGLHAANTSPQAVFS